MLSYVPESALRVLDVGCATGRFGVELVTSHPGLEVWGIDPVAHPQGFPDPYRTRITGTFPDDLPLSAGLFDCVVFNDVLEHLVDPWSVLAQTRAHLEPGGVVVASIPNVRSVRVLRPLVLGGRWEYQDYGILDRTHLRFFTRASIVEMVERAGYAVTRVEPIRIQAGGRLARLNRLVRGRLDDFLAERFAVVGKLPTG